MKKLEQKHITALKASIAASKKIMEIYARNFDVEIKADNSPVTEADLAASEIIAQHLKQTDIPILGEELTKQAYDLRKNWKENWCVDPLDGTKEYIKKNGEFVVNIALIEKNAPSFGLIASPVKQEIIFGGKEFGGFITHFDDINYPEKWKALNYLNSVNQPLVTVSSRSHHSGNTLSIMEKVHAKYGEENRHITMGSALKFFLLVTGEADFYPRFAPTMEWDIASGQAIYEALGGEVLNAETGKNLSYNKENLRNPFFIAKKKVLTY